MTAREIVERVRRRDIAADELRLYGALETLEEKIRDYARLPEKQFSEDGELYAPEMFFDTYEEYLKRDNAIISEDWDCYERHEGLFRAAWERYCEYAVRNAELREQKFKTGTGWT